MNKITNLFVNEHCKQSELQRKNSKSVIPPHLINDIKKNDNVAVILLDITFHVLILFKYLQYLNRKNFSNLHARKKYNA